jgi:hypothetical protein
MKIKITTILLGLLVGSIAYHLNVDSEKIMDLPSYQVSWIAMSLGALISGFLISIFSKYKVIKVALLLFLGIILSIIGRMVYDSYFTSSTHHLAGLEIIVYSIISFSAAFVGAYLGQLINRWQKN